MTNYSVSDLEHLREKLAAAYNSLHRLGLFDYAGDVSLRLEDGSFLIRGARVAFTQPDSRSRTSTSPNDVLRISPDGVVITGDLPIPIETAMHVEIYRKQPDTRAVLHAHARMITAVSMVQESIPPIHTRGVECTGGALGFFDCPDPVASQELAIDLVDALAENRGCMIRSHGLVTIGESLEAACLAGVNLEDSAHMLWLTQAIGIPKSLPEASVLERKRIWENPNFAGAVWQYYEELGNS